MFVKVSILGALCLFGVAFGAPIEGQVVNGTDAKEGEIPYIVSLRSYHNHNCGGTILDANHIMTAAHCAQYANPASLSIQYGVTAITAGSDAPNLIQVESLVVNPDFIPGSGYYNDVAVLRLAEPIVFGPNVQPIQLPRAFNATPENCQATLSGWGLPFSGGAVMEHLQKAVITVYTDDDCERIHEQTGPTNRNYNICAGIPEGGKGQCNGDSGGPLVCDGVQVGIVSWSVKPCTVKGYPGVFTKVSAEIPFVDQQLLN